jgi:UDP-N-acetylmuramate dehydrogenase
MLSSSETQERLSAIASLQLTRNEPLARHTRFGLGGPARLFADTAEEGAFLEALGVAQASSLPWLVIGLGTNLIVSDEGYPGVVIRFRGAGISRQGQTVSVQAGAVLQDLINYTIGHGLEGLEVMTGIPGNVGAAIYGNAGAYGASMSDRVARVRYFDGEAVRTASREECGFRYRDSLFKQERLAGRPLLIVSAELEFRAGDAEAMRAKADPILAARNAKFPPEMKCAGSIFKNLIVAELPAQARERVPQEIVKGGKVPAAWFLEQAGAKGLSQGGIRVTEYHANTLYNAGDGTAADFCALVRTLKERVHKQFGLQLEEEVQYIGFEPCDLP